MYINEDKEINLLGCVSRSDTLRSENMVKIKKEGIGLKNKMLYINARSIEK